VQNTCGLQAWSVPEKHSEVSRVVGNRIKILRTDMQISQTDLADMALVHVANLGKIERGLTNPSLATLARIATALDTRLSTLVADVLPEHLPESDRQITAADLLRARSDQRNSRSANER
jgi:transcriptional regulator with XRE-family HTH domain